MDIVYSFHRFTVCILKFKRQPYETLTNTIMLLLKYSKFIAKSGDDILRPINQYFTILR